MPRNIKQILSLALFGFILYAIITDPESAADIVRSIWDIIVTGLRNIGRFFAAILE